MQSLTSIDLQGNECGDLGAQYLAEALNVNTVSINLSSLTKIHLLFQGLTSLNLDFNGIEALGAEHLLSALKVNRVSVAFILSSIFILSHRH